MRPIFHIILLCMIGVSCKSPKPVEPQIEEERPGLYAPPSPNDTTIGGIMVKRGFLIPAHLFESYDKWHYSNDALRKKHIDLGKKIYEEYYYTMFDSLVYDEQDKRNIEAILLKDSTEYFYFGYVYSLHHTPTCLPSWRYESVSPYRYY